MSINISDEVFENLPVDLQFAIISNKYNNDHELESEILRYIDPISFSSLKCENKKKCNLCNSIDVIRVSNNNNSWIYVCNTCFNTTIDESNDEEPDEKCKSSYRRIQYFNEYLDRHICCKPPSITDEELMHLKIMIKKAGIDDITSLRTDQLDKFLMRLGCSKSYHEKAYIYNRLAGIPHLELSPADREKINLMFHEIESVWNTIKVPNENSFINYSYLGRKIFELLELDNYFYLWKLSVSQENLIEYDKIWYQICKILQYEFISTNR